jgi:putative hydrolase of the HAD superfamily
MEVRALVFDRDGVITTTDRERFGREVLARIPLEPAELAERWQAWNRGRALRDADDETLAIQSFLEALADELALDAAKRARFRELDYTEYVRCYDDAREALCEAHLRGLRVGVLTNNSMGVSPSRMLAAAGLDGLVDVALSAQMIGARKPDPAAYAAIAAALDAPLAGCLFFDDNRAWVEGARAMGMRAFELDRGRAEHDVAAGILRDLSAVPLILDGITS